MRAGKTTSQIRGATENTDILRRTACPLPDASPACVLRRSLITGPGVVLPLCTHTHQRQSKNCAYFCAPCEAPTSYAPCEAPSSMLSSRSLSIPLLLASHSCFCWSMPCSVFPLLVRRMTVVILSSSASPSATIAFSSNVCVWVGAQVGVLDHICYLWAGWAGRTATIDIGHIRPPLSPSMEKKS